MGTKATFTDSMIADTVFKLLKQTQAGQIESNRRVEAVIFEQRQTNALLRELISAVKSGG